MKEPKITWELTGDKYPGDHFGMHYETVEGEDEDGVMYYGIAEVTHGEITDIEDIEKVINQQ